MLTGGCRHRGQGAARAALVPRWRQGLAFDMRSRTTALLVVLGISGVLAGCGDNADDDAVATYCENVAEYVQLAQDAPTNPEVEVRLREIEAEGADSSDRTTPIRARSTRRSSTSAATGSANRTGRLMRRIVVALACGVIAVGACVAKRSATGVTPAPPPRPAPLCRPTMPWPSTAPRWRAYVAAALENPNDAAVAEQGEEVTAQGQALAEQAAGPGGHRSRRAPGVPAPVDPDHAPRGLTP